MIGPQTHSRAGGQDRSGENHDSRCLIVSRLRCIEHAELEVPRGRALVCTDNASGSTSLLEAVFASRSGHIVPYLQQCMSDTAWTGSCESHWDLPRHVQGVGFEATRDDTARIGGRSPRRPEAQLAWPPGGTATSGSAM
jgi:hypothetical protein